MYFHICPHKHTHTISFFYTHSKEIFKITFLKLKVQELFQALSLLCPSISAGQVWGYFVCGGGGGGVTLCVADGGEGKCKCAVFVDCLRED